jgi:hypothetical protein
MIALLFAFVVGVVCIWVLWLAGAMLAGFFVGLSQIATDIIRRLRGLPPKDRRKPVAHANRVPVPFEVRAAVWMRDGGACVYCGATDDLTIDHVTPRIIGGTNDPENLVTACRPCNSSKGTGAAPHPARAAARQHVISLWRADQLVERATHNGNGNGNGKHWTRAPD